MTENGLFQNNVQITTLALAATHVKTRSYIILNPRMWLLKTEEINFRQAESH